MTWENDHIGYKQAVYTLAKKRFINPPPKNSIIFIGSSIFRLWHTLESDMNPLPVFNQTYDRS